MECFTSRFNRVLAVCAWVIVVFAMTAYVWAHQGFTQPLWLAPAAFVAFAAWAWLWHPSVQVDERGVTLVNLVRSVRVPWAALIQVDTRFALTLRTPKGSYSAWAAPAPGRTGVALAKRREVRASSAHIPDVGASARPGDLLGTESGTAAALVRRRWYELRESGGIELGVADSSRAIVTILWRQDAILVALLAASAASAPFL